MIADQDPCTHDSLFDGALFCLQPRKGYRFSLDAVLLGHFVSPGPRPLILELGAGCGIVSLILAYLHPGARITALELQPGLLELLKKNIELNRFSKRVIGMRGDLRNIAELLPAESFDLVLSNPPYRKEATGRKNLLSEQAIARHEISATLSEVIAAASFALKKKGRLAMVYPSARGAGLFYELRKEGLEPKRLQVVYSFPGDQGRLLLVEAVKGGGEELIILPPFFVFREQGGPYSDEMAACYQRTSKEGEKTTA